MRKPRDEEMARRNQSERKPLYGLDAQHLLQLDTTDLDAGATCDSIVTWLESNGVAPASG